jgi:uncharacterized protein YegL
MDISNFIKKEGRALPVFLLVDTSRSMEGEKIEAVNVAIKEMINSFKKIANPKGIIELAILSFGGDEVKVIKELSKISDVEYFQFDASGKTPMGKAFKAVTDLIEDYNVVSSRAYTPTIVLISDGNPTDFEGYNESYTQEQIMQWDALKALHSGSRSSKATKLAMGIGDDVDVKILKAFINDDSIPVIKSNDNHTIQKFFEWVTMSISVRSVSVNPNQVEIDTYIFDKDEMEF